jgi:rare lipoprotein A
VKQRLLRISVLSLFFFSFTSAAAQAQEGVASWYGPGFHGKRTASGEIYDKEAFTAAHKSLPFGTYVRVQSLDTGAGVVVRINDRGPFVEGRVLDLSEAAARVIGMIQSGTARVSFKVIPKDEALAWKGANPDGSIPREIPEGPASAKPAQAEQRVRIQVASYAQEANAKATLQRLALSGIDARIEKSGPYHRIVVENLSVAASRELAQRLEALGYRGFLITTIAP